MAKNGAKGAGVIIVGFAQVKDPPFGNWTKRRGPTDRFRVRRP